LKPSNTHPQPIQTLLQKKSDGIQTGEYTMIAKTKPSKPSPDFPLFAHASGKWAKKIAGKLVYFGRWDDPQEALRAYERSLAAVSSDKMTASRWRTPVIAS
jgi:hypothetical protein